jgi:hypothetical protein
VDLASSGLEDAVLVSRAAFRGRPWPLLLLAILLPLLPLAGIASPSDVAAAGAGPAIGFGPEGGNAVAVVATTASPRPYKGFNIHIRFDVGDGLDDLAITANADDGTLGSTGLGPPLCVVQAPASAPDDRIFSCTTLGLGGSVSPGLLALFTLSAAGSGCVEASLVAGSGDLQLDTYTIDAIDSTRQENVVDTGTLQRVLIGAAGPFDCPSSPPPPEPTAPPPAPSSDAGSAGGGEDTTTMAQEVASTPEATAVGPTATAVLAASSGGTAVAGGAATVAVTPLSVRNVSEPVSEVGGSQSASDDGSGGGNTIAYLLIGGGVLVLAGLAMRAYLRNNGMI